MILFELGQLRYFIRVDFIQLIKLLPADVLRSMIIGMSLLVINGYVIYVCYFSNERRFFENSPRPS